MPITSNTAAKVIATCLIMSVSMQICCSSAIPIWEFLTRNEKMSYLYSTFAQLVSMHCKATAIITTPVNQCKRNLLAYGYEKLQTFSNEQLDAFDPYQRGASEIIWSSIMREHPSSTLITTRKPLPIAPATSIIILTHQNPVVKPFATNPKEKDESTAVPSNTNRQQYPKNPIFETEIEKGHSYATDMDIAYGGNSGKPIYNPAQVEVFDQDQEQNHEPKKEQTFLSGPSVVRVRPDGTPVDNTHPKDEDLEAFQLLPPTDAPNQFVRAAPGRPAKHRKIATISALKQQYLNSLAIQQQQLQPPIEEPVQELQPPLERLRARRQFPAHASTGYYSA